MKLIKIVKKSDAKVSWNEYLAAAKKFWDKARANKDARLLLTPAFKGSISTNWDWIANKFKRGLAADYPLAVDDGVRQILAEVKKWDKSGEWFASRQKLKEFFRSNAEKLLEMYESANSEED